MGIAPSAWPVRKIVPVDPVMWLYGSGFPKSLDVSKAIDKAAGVERRVVGIHRHGGLATSRESTYTPTVPPTPQAHQWQGWGTALKPAWEPIVIARKPLDGRVAQNVCRHGTGALNIDGCRIGFASHADERESKAKNRHEDLGSAPRKNHVYGRDERPQHNYTSPGRWPANVLLSHTPECRPLGNRRVRSNGHHPRARGEGRISTTGHRGQKGLVERSITHELVRRWQCSPDCPVKILDEQSGERRTDIAVRHRSNGTFGSQIAKPPMDDLDYRNTGGASRFFYCAKASRTERDAGLGEFNKATTEAIDNPHQRGKTLRHNIHPTVKPIGLMRYLVRLVTPPGGIVLDPFAGSGTTGIAAVLEGARFLGIERNPDYVAIARARIRHWARLAERRNQ